MIKFVNVKIIRKMNQMVWIELPIGAGGRIHCTIIIFCSIDEFVCEVFCAIKCARHETTNSKLYQLYGMCSTVKGQIKTRTQKYVQRL